MLRVAYDEYNIDECILLRDAPSTNQPAVVCLSVRCTVEIQRSYRSFYTYYFKMSTSYSRQLLSFSYWSCDAKLNRTALTAIKMPSTLSAAADNELLTVFTFVKRKLKYIWTIITPSSHINKVRYQVKIIIESRKGIQRIFELWGIILILIGRQWFEVQHDLWTKIKLSDGQ